MGTIHHVAVRVAGIAEFALGALRKTP